MQKVLKVIKEFRFYFTGDFDQDLDFLKNHVIENEKDPKIRQVLHLVLISELPEDKKKEVAREFSLIDKGNDSLLELIHELVSGGYVDEAENLTGALVEAIREQIPEQTDSTGFYFESPLELEFYRQRHCPTTPELKGSYPPVNHIYQIAAYVLVELDRSEEARPLLMEAISRNPLNTKATFELAETYKEKGEFSAFLAINKICCELMYQPNDIARYFRNLGFYFIEEENWDLAIGAYYESLNWADSEVSKRELFVIFKLTGEPPEKPNDRDTFLIAISDLGIPVPPNPLWIKSAKNVFYNPKEPISTNEMFVLLSLILKWTGSSYEMENMKIFQKIMEAAQEGENYELEPGQWCEQSLKKKAVNKDSYAACAMALCYKSGSFIEQNEQLYLDWIKKASHLGNPLAMFYLGKHKLSNCKDMEDAEQSFSWMKKAAIAGLDIAQSYIGNCYLSGLFVEQDFELFSEWNTKASNQGLPTSLWQFGRAYLEGKAVEKDVDSAIAFFKRAAIHGDLESQNILENLYESGDLVKQDLQKKLFWAQRAAEQGNIPAQIRLATHYQEAEPTEYNRAKYFHWSLQVAYRGVFKEDEKPNLNHAPGPLQNHDGEEKKDSKIEEAITLCQYSVALYYQSGNGVEKDLEEAVIWAHRAAVRGCVEAQFFLGCIYTNGEEIEQNQDLALSWFRKAAGEGLADAQYQLALHYMEESSPEHDLDLAIEWCRKSAEQGYEFAQHSLGVYYLKGNGVERDLLQAKHWLSLAAEQGVEESKDILSSLIARGEEYEQKTQELIELQESLNALEKKQEVFEEEHKFTTSISPYLDEESPDYNPDLAVKVCREAVERGDAEAQYLLGLFYYSGESVEQNYDTAISLFQLAAKQDHPESQYQLFYIYSNGIGTSIDRHQAYMWVIKAAEQGDVDAQYVLGDDYRSGNYFYEDPSKSLYWFQQAAEQGHGPSMVQLGYAYYRGYGVQEDIHTFLSFMKRAAGQDEVEAQYFLGLFYRVGKKEIQQDFSKSIDWFLKAAERNDAGAQYYLGRSNLDGDGVTKDHKKAKAWLEKSANQNHPDALYLLASTDFEYEGVVNSSAKQWGWWIGAAQHGHNLSQLNLGEHYFCDSSEERDHKIGVSWLRRAAKGGNAKAQYLLGRAYSTGKGVKKNLKKAEKWYEEASSQGYEEGEDSILLKPLNQVSK
jgi:uncharacterized protein